MLYSVALSFRDEDYNSDASGEDGSQTSYDPRRPKFVGKDSEIPGLVDETSSGGVMLLSHKGTCTKTICGREGGGKDRHPPGELCYFHIKVLAGKQLEKGRGRETSSGVVMLLSHKGTCTKTTWGRERGERERHPPGELCYFMGDSCWEGGVGERAVVHWETIFSWNRMVCHE